VAELNRLHAQQMAAGLRAGDFTASELLDAHLAAIRATDGSIHAWLDTDDAGATEQARAADARLAQARANGGTGGLVPMLGIPVGLKDLVLVRGRPATAGSRMLEGYISPYDAHITERLREQGAVIVGRTNMDEFAMGSSTEHSAWGPTRNPWDLERVPGGSSGGSAAAIAVGLCPIAIGTQTCMSIIGPASFCGVVGYKPSWGTIPADGLVLMSESIDTIGFLAQDVDSVTLAATVLTEIGEVKPATDKAVLGVPLSLMRSKLHDYAEDAYRKQLKTLAAAGFEVRTVEFMDFDYVQDAFRHTSLVLGYEMARVHRDWFPKFSHLYRKRTADGIRFGQTVTDEQYRAGQAFARDFRARIGDLMDSEGIDLWTLPGSNGAAPEGYQTTGWIDQTGIWGLAGLGSVVVPAGFAPNGLPLGLQFLPRFGDDARLLSWVSDIEPLFAGIKAKLMQAA
jgi:Asp-tRNA(Asn)/Glu-tRNA(Gln) amidotransferase A subunit family amidase